MLFIDNPAGVGYSYAERSIDYKANDNSFSKDAMVFLEAFFKDWPELRKNPLYMSGISYGGIYAPYMTWMLHQHNLHMKAIGNETSLFNIKGYVIGNGITDFNFDGFVTTAMDVFPTFSHLPYAKYLEYHQNNCSFRFDLALPGKNNNS